jgi:hypothetical protein
MHLEVFLKLNSPKNALSEQIFFKNPKKLKTQKKQKKTKKSKKKPLGWIKKKTGVFPTLPRPLPNIFLFLHQPCFSFPTTFKVP